MCCLRVACLVLAAVVSWSRAVGEREAASRDWLITNITTPVTVELSGDSLVLSNGLISRTFTLSPAFGTTDYLSHVANRSLLRAINDEAELTLDGVKYGVGGLRDNLDTHAFLNRSQLSLSADPATFQFAGYTTSKPTAPFHWEVGLRHSPLTSRWPPEGQHLSVTFLPPSSVKPEHSGLVITLHYEMYVGIPLLAKWLTLDNTNSTMETIVVDTVTVEYLATQKPYNLLDNSMNPNPVSHSDTGPVSSWMYVQPDQPHGSECQWQSDPRAAEDYGADEQILVCEYSSGASFLLGQPDAEGKVLASVDTFRVLELVTDSDDRERVGLSRHRMTRLLAPETQENPIFFHGTDHTPQGFKIAVEQMATVGFEMFIYSFGSGFEMENTDPAYIAGIAEQVAFAKQYNIEVGGYDLIDLARGGMPEWDCIDENGGVTGDACFASGWYDHIHGIIFNFINKTGISMLETDGPYGGQTCYSLLHSHHFGYADSVFQQNRRQMQFYEELKLMNVFINQPDRYFFQGGNKVGMGYNERQFNLPRWEDLTVSRQSMFDDTYYHLPTQGWMQVPLIQYHGGGEAAEFDPMTRYLLAYEWALAQYLSYGVAACYRGPRLYDSVQAMAVARKWVGFYKKYRDIVTSDIVHVRRPDMQSYDCILHVNPFITNRGLAVVFNPTSTSLNFTLSLPLYYTGITNQAVVMHEGGNPVNFDLDRDYKIYITMTMKAKSITWFLIHTGD